jgi:alkaline phosphatase D
LTADSWDGYPTERNELMTFLRTEQVKNVVVLSGDIHAAFAGTIADNYDAASPQTVACELVGPGVTSNSLFSFFEAATRANADLRGLITVSEAGAGGAKFIENLNLMLLHGTISAGTFAGAIAQGAPVAGALQAALAPGTDDPQTNAHLQYVDTNAQGYGYLKVTGDEVAASIVTINRPITAPTDAGPGIKRAARFTIPKDNPAGMTLTEITGTKPFPVQ